MRHSNAALPISMCGRAYDFSEQNDVLSSHQKHASGYVAELLTDVDALDCLLEKQIGVLVNAAQEPDERPTVPQEHHELFCKSTKRHDEFSGLFGGGVMKNCALTVQLVQQRGGSGRERVHRKTNGRKKKTELPT